MSEYHASVRGGYRPVSQTSHTEASGATPFAALSGGRAYTLQVKSGTLKINFTGATGDWLELGPGLYRDVVDSGVLKTARVDTASPYAAVLLYQVAA